MSAFLEAYRAERAKPHPLTPKVILFRLVMWPSLALAGILTGHALRGLLT